MEKRLQIFISSTYEDLKDERQAAVQAILLYGHIPAGMELFAAGDEEQFKVIKRWIDESDIFMLILGKRYGSIEPNTGKSYTELEYEYAVSTHKPIFAIVMTDDWLNMRLQNITNIGTIVEENNKTSYDKFSFLVKSKMCSFASDTKDIKIYTLNSINDLSMRYKLVGWIRDIKPYQPADDKPSYISNQIKSDDLLEKNEKSNTILPLGSYIIQRGLFGEWLKQNLKDPSSRRISNFKRDLDLSLANDNSLRLFIGSDIIKKPYNKFVTITPHDFQVVYTNLNYKELKETEPNSVLRIGFTTEIEEEYHSEHIYKLTNINIEYRQKGSKLIICVKYGPIQTLRDQSISVQVYAAISYSIANFERIIYYPIEIDSQTNIITFENELMPTEKDDIIWVSGSISFRGFLCLDSSDEESESNEHIIISDIITKRIVLPDMMSNTNFLSRLLQK